MTNKYIYTIRDINIKDLTREHLATLSIDELIEIIICFKNEFAANENMYDVINQESMNLKNELDESCDDYKHLKDLHNQALKDLDETQDKCEKLINKNNRLTEELNQIKLLLEGKNTQYNTKVKECEELQEEICVLNTANGAINNLNKYIEEQRDIYFKTLKKSTMLQNIYLKAIEDIEKICLADTHTFADGTQVRYDSLDKILDIIKKVRSDNNDK